MARCPSPQCERAHLNMNESGPEPPWSFELMHRLPVLSSLSTVLGVFFLPLPNNSYHMGWASASQLLNDKHSFDCKLNGKGCQLSLSSCGHTTRAPAVKNWHSCSERHHMLLLLAEQYLTLALLTPLYHREKIAKIRASLLNMSSLRDTSRHLSTVFCFH